MACLRHFFCEIRCYPVLLYQPLSVYSCEGYCFFKPLRRFAWFQDLQSPSALLHVIGSPSITCRSARVMTDGLLTEPKRGVVSREATIFCGSGMKLGGKRFHNVASFGKKLEVTHPRSTRPTRRGRQRQASLTQGYNATPLASVRKLIMYAPHDQALFKAETPG